MKNGEQIVNFSNCRCSFYDLRLLGLKYESELETYFVAKGGYGKVNAFVYNNRCYAIKLIKYGPLRYQSKKDVESEIKHLLLLKSKYVIELKATFHWSDKSVYGLVTKFFGNDFSELKKQLQEKPLKLLMKHLLNGMKYMHDNGYTHGDLKLENIVYDKYDCRIIDFGAVQKTSLSSTLDDCGSRTTLWYRAPERLIQGTVFDEKCDVWSLGVCFANLLYGQVFFRSVGEKQYKQMVKEFNIQYVDSSKNHILDLVKKMLIKDPKKRCTIDEALKHKVFS